MTEIANNSQKIKQRKVLAKLLRFIIQRRMSAPALFALESVRPLSFLASQTLITFEPIIRTVLPLPDYEIFTQAIEDRDNIEWMIQQLEAVEQKQGQQPEVTAKHSDES